MTTWSKGVGESGERMLIRSPDNSTVPGTHYLIIFTTIIPFWARLIKK